MKKILIMIGFVMCANVFAADQRSKAVQKTAKVEGCCKVCKIDVSKPCGNACISLNKECGKRNGCACTPDGKHELEEKPIWVAPK